MFRTKTQGFIQGVQMAGGAVKTLDTTQTLAKTTENLVKVGERTARLLKTEGSHSLVDLGKGVELWLPNSAIKPTGERNNKGVSLGQRLIYGAKGALRGALDGYRKKPKVHQTIITHF